jgi:hypothetical protein
MAVLAEQSAPPYAAAANFDPTDPYGKMTSTAASTLSFMYMSSPQNYTPVIYSWGHDKIMQTADDILSFRLMVAGNKGN